MIPDGDRIIAKGVTAQMLADAGIAPSSGEQGVNLYLSMRGNIKAPLVGGGIPELEGISFPTEAADRRLTNIPYKDLTYEQGIEAARARERLESGYDYASNYDQLSEAERRQVERGYRLAGEIPIKTLEEKEREKEKELAKGKQAFEQLVSTGAIPSDAVFTGYNEKTGNITYELGAERERIAARANAIAVLAPYKDQTSGNYSLGDILASKNDKAIEVAKSLWPQDATKFLTDNTLLQNGSWVSKEFIQNNVQLDTGEWVSKESLASLTKDQQAHLQKKGLVAFNAIGGQVLPTSGEKGFVSSDVWIPDYFKQKGWEWQGDRWLADADLTTLEGQKKAMDYGDHLTEATKVYQDAFRPPISWVDYLDRYARDTDVNLNINWAEVKQSEMDKVNITMRDAANSYVSQYGQRAMTATMLGAAGELIVPALRAIKPEVSIKDISGGEWAASAAIAVLYAAGPASSAVRGLGASARAASTLANSMKLASGTTLLTTSLADTKMPALQRAVYGTMGTVLVFANGKAILNSLVPPPKSAMTVERLLQQMKKEAQATSNLTIRELNKRLTTLAEDYPANKATILKDAEVVRKEFGGSVAGKFRDYSMAQQNLIKIAERKLQLERNIPQAEAYANTLDKELAILQKMKGVSETATGAELVKHQELIRNQMNEAYATISGNKAELAKIAELFDTVSKKVSGQAKNLTKALRADVLSHKTDKIIVLGTDDFETLSQRWESFPDTVKALLQESPVKTNVAAMTNDLNNLRAVIAAQKQVIRAIGTPINDTDAKRLIVWQDNLKATQVKVDILEKQVANELFSFGKGIYPEKGGGYQFNYGDVNPPILVAEPPAGTSTGISVELNKPIPWRTDGIIDAVAKISIATANKGEPLTQKEWEQIPEVQKVIKQMPVSTPEQITQVQHDIGVASAPVVEFIQDNGLGNKNDQATNQAIKQAVEQSISNQIAQTPSIQPATQTQTQTQTTTKTKIDIAHPHVEIPKISRVILPEKPKTEEQKTEALGDMTGAVGWKQGKRRGKPVFHIVKRPYAKQSDLVTTVGKAPAGIALATGKGSAQKSARLLHGAGPKNVNIDMGAMDVNIQSKGKNVRLKFAPDPHGLTHYPLHIGNPKPRASNALPTKRVGKQYFTDMNGHIAVSRRPIGRRGKR